MVAAVVAVSLAFVGYLATYVNGLRLTQRQERLSRINRQLAEFYGPLLALTQSNRRIFEEFARRHQRRDGTSPFRSEAQPTGEELVEWRLRFSTVFMPNIRSIRDVVINKADLLIESSMPPVLLDLCAHVSGFEITVRRWSQEDYTEHGSVVAYPALDLHTYAGTSFARLKRQQAKLLGSSRESLGRTTNTPGPLLSVIRRPSAQPGGRQADDGTAPGCPGRPGPPAAGRPGPPPDHDHRIAAHGGMVSEEDHRHAGGRDLYGAGARRPVGSTGAPADGRRPRQHSAQRRQIT